MSFSERLEQIKTGFERPFWVANVTELFERLSYYAAFASLARYLHEALMFPVQQASSLTGLFGGLVWFMAAFGGTVADRSGISPRALSGVPDSELLLFCVGIAGLSVACAAARPHAADRSGQRGIGAARARYRAGKTCRGRNDCARFKRKRSLYRLFNLLHAGQYWRRCRAVRGFMGASPHERGKCIPRCGGQRLPDVFCRADFFREPRRSDEVQTTSLESLKNFGTVLGIPGSCCFC